MKKPLCILLLSLCPLFALWAQKDSTTIPSERKVKTKSSSDWLIGINIPTASHQTWSDIQEIDNGVLGTVVTRAIRGRKRLMPGISVGYRGWTTNLYLVFTAETLLLPEQESYSLENVLFNIGYQYSFGLGDRSPFKPVIGGYLGYENFELSLGFAYRRVQFLSSLTFYSSVPNRKQAFLPFLDDRSPAIVNLKLQYRI